MSIFEELIYTAIFLVAGYFILLMLWSKTV